MKYSRMQYGIGAMALAFGLAAACGNDSTRCEGSACVSAEAGAPIDTTDLAALAGYDAEISPLMTSDPQWSAAIIGVRVTKDGKLELLDKARAPIAPAITLARETLFGSAVMVGHVDDLLGAKDVTVIARRSSKEATTLIVTILPTKHLPKEQAGIGSTLRPLSDPPGDARAADRARRMGYLDAWEGLKAQPTSGARQFAQLVQIIVTTNANRFPDSPSTARAHIVDDILDTFVDSGHQWEKERLMATTASVLNPEKLQNEGVPEAAYDPPLLKGFGKPFHRGEGRLRHFGANLGMANKAYGLIPDAVITFTAICAGSDWFPEEDPSGDETADRATNAVGRDFYDFLNQLVDENRLGDTSAVVDWMVDRFGNPGAACADGRGCASGFCVDGVCCRRECNELCMACAGVKTGDADGLCGYVKAGTDPDQECLDRGPNACGPNATGCMGSAPKCNSDCLGDAGADAAADADPTDAADDVSVDATVDATADATPDVAIIDAGVDAADAADACSTAEEICDGIDNNCNAAVDEGCPTGLSGIDFVANSPTWGYVGATPVYNGSSFSKLCAFPAALVSVCTRSNGTAVTALGGGCSGLTVAKNTSVTPHEFSIATVVPADCDSTGLAGSSTGTVINRKCPAGSVVHRVIGTYGTTITDKINSIQVECVQLDLVRSAGNVWSIVKGTTTLLPSDGPGGGTSSFDWTAPDTATGKVSFIRAFGGRYANPDGLYQLFGTARSTNLVVK